MHFSTAAILGALAAVPLASGLGINCRGSGYCVGSSSTMRDLLNYANNNVPDNAYFGNGQQIICNNARGGICVFFQSLPGSTSKSGAVVKSSLNDLVNHGCNVCGSDPTEPGNDVSKGQLTVNWVQFSQPAIGYVS